MTGKLLLQVYHLWLLPLKEKINTENTPELCRRP